MPGSPSSDPSRIAISSPSGHSAPNRLEPQTRAERLHASVVRPEDADRAPRRRAGGSPRAAPAPACRRRRPSASGSASSGSGWPRGTARSPRSAPPRRGTSREAGARGSALRSRLLRRSRGARRRSGRPTAACRACRPRASHSETRRPCGSRPRCRRRGRRATASPPGRTGSRNSLTGRPSGGSPSPISRFNLLDPILADSLECHDACECHLRLPDRLPGPYVYTAARRRATAGAKRSGRPRKALSMESSRAG